MSKKLTSLVIGVLLAIPYSAEAQTGSISGFITDSLQNPVQYARISVNGTVNAAITDVSGNYLIDDLTPGNYNLTVNHSEFHTTAISDITVEQDSATELNVGLLPSQFAALANPLCYPGYAVFVPLYIDNVIAISEINFLLRWPADYLTVISIDQSYRIGYGNFAYIIDDAGPGTVRIHWDAGAFNPMPGGNDPVAWLQVQPDTSLNIGSFVPIWFYGSQSDNAIYDSAGLAINFDDYQGGSIFIHDEPWLAYNPNANGWRVDLGDLAIVPDRLIIGYIVWSHNGTGDDALQEAAADLNGNGFVDIADLVRLYNLAQGYTTLGNYPLLKFPADTDPGERDVISVGNLDGGSIIGYPGQTVEIPIYTKIDEDIRGFALRIMADATQIMEWLGADTTSVFNWGFDVSNEIDYQPGYGGQTALSVAAGRLSFNTNGQWSDAIAYFTLRLSDSGFAGGETIQLKARASMADTNYVVYQPLIIEGSILVDIAECDYIRGDANSDSSFNGLDVIYSVNYFKGQGPPPPTDCYCGINGFYGANADSNGDCRFNGIDVIYSVAALKGTGPMPQACPDCPPE